MRGKGGNNLGARLYRRITPAYAGKRPLKSRPPAARWDHPRVCGEKLCLNVIPNSIKGITPAYAGKRIPKVYLLMQT